MQEQAAVQAAEQTTDESKGALHAGLAHLQELADQRATERAVERLRASKAQHDEGQGEAGVEAGREWARFTAEFNELKALGTAWPALRRERLLDGVGDFVVRTVAGPVGHRTHREEILEQLVDEDEDGNRPALDEDGFWRGFAEGATEVWEKVGAQL
ncbi:MAG: hypothetical protein AB1716_15715 [Planctomycetota bacterium]